MATALITGASGGIGAELARVHASKGGDLVLVARSGDKLRALKSDLEAKYGIKVLVIPKDLSKTGAAQEIYEATVKEGIAVEYLVNNAGFGIFGLFEQTGWKREEEMINLNITALTHLTKLYVKDMMQLKSGRIMNVASTAAFQPGPRMAVYFATKAYVLHFSEAIGYELKRHNISVTALCPGPTESGFQAASAMDQSALIKGKKIPSSREVAEYGYKAMMKGKAVAVHGAKNLLLTQAIRFTPRALVVQLLGKMLDR